MNNIINTLKKLGSPEKAKHLQRFFKTEVGQYAHGDIFWGITVPEVRKIAKTHKDLDIKYLEKMLEHKVHEVRLCALLIMISQSKTDTKNASKIYNLYLKKTAFINNWDLVDLSAREIVGDFLIDKDCSILYKLAKSDILWERRIAIIATYAFIRNGQTELTLKLAQVLMNDKHDLIHKAVGWMLREVGKRCSINVLENFLKQQATTMPRTTLRYAIEHMSDKKRKYFMQMKIGTKKILGILFLSLFASSSLLAMKISYDDNSSFARRERVIAKLTAARKIAEEKLGPITRKPKKKYPKKIIIEVTDELTSDEILIASIWANKPDMITEAIKDGANPHIKTDGYALLHYATLMHASLAVPCLIEAEININARIHGWPAALNKNPSPLQTRETAFIALGKYSQNETINNITPLHLAVLQKNSFITYCLIRAGANEDARDSRGQTPLSWAYAQEWSDTYYKIADGAKADRVSQPEPQGASAWLEAFNTLFPITEIDE